MEQIDGRFEIKNGEVGDLYSDRKFRLADLPEEYLSAKYEAGFIQPAAYIEHRIVLEETAAGHLSVSEILEENEVLSKMLPLFMALSFMHSRGLVYGNLSPDAILDAEDGYYIDSFGIGETQIEKNDYSAYEYYAYQGKGCPASDVYSAGVIMYELFTGIHISNAEMRVDAEEELEPLAAFGISDQTQEAVMKALNVFADDRYKNMTEFMQALYPEKQIENFRNDHKIKMRKIRTEDENIEEKLNKAMSVPENGEEHENRYIDDEPMQPSKNKIGAIAGILICSVLLIGIAVMAFIPQQEKKGKAIRQIKTEAVEVRDIAPDYEENAEPTAEAALKDMTNVLFTEAERIAILGGYAVTRKDADSSVIEKNHVISQTVKDKTVTFVVSKGIPEPKITPELAKTPAPATEAPKKAKKPKKTKIPTKKPANTPKPVKEPAAKETSPASKPKATKKPLTLDDGGDFTLK